MNQQEVINDFRRRYESTYVWLGMPEQNTETLVHVDAIVDNPTKMAVMSLTSQKYGQMQVNFGSCEYSLKFKYPPVGVFQCGNEPYVFLRRPARQYRRGLCGDNSQMFNVTKGLVGTLTRWTYAEVEAAFAHETFTFREAILRLQSENKLKGVALQEEYSIIRSIDVSPNHILFHWNNPIARISPQGKLTHLLEATYGPEIELMLGSGL